MKTQSIILAALVALGLSACAGYPEVKKNVDQDHAEKSAVVASAQKEIAKRPAYDLISYSSKPWFASRAVAREKTDSLPARFDSVTLRFPGRHTIGSVAEILHRTTGIKVMVHPDVFVNPKVLAPRAGGSFTAQASGTSGTMTTSAVGGAGVASATMSPPVQAGAPAQGVQVSGAGDYYVDVPVDYRGPLNEFLDQLAIRLGVDWEYRDGRIEIRRFVTRTFNIVALPGKNDFTSSLGKRGGVSAGVQASGGAAGAQSASAGQFNSDMNVSTETHVDYWASIEGSIRAMLSPLGKVAVNQGSGIVTVTDIRDVVDRVASMIEEENRTVTRNVGFEVQVFSLSNNDGSDFGVDWNLIYQRLSNLSPEWGLSFASPGSLVSTLAGQVGVQVLKTPSNDNGTLDRMSGSTAFVKALATYGKLSRVTSQRVITLNRKPVPVAITQQTAYAAATQPGSVATGGAATSATYGITPGSVTTGFILNLVPTITERNSIVLTFSVDLSDLLDMKTFTSGSGGTSQSIQLPEVSATQFIQNVPLRSGETLVVTGFERTTHRYNQRTLGRGMEPGLGGSLAGSGAKESLVIMITPIIREGV